MANATPRRIELKGPGRYEESRATAIIKPGHLIAIDGDGACAPHTVAGGRCEKAFAIEDALRGRTIDDAYAVGDLIPYIMPQPGDWVNVLIKAGQNVSKGDHLVSNGDGCLVVVRDGNVVFSNAASSAAVTNTTVETAFDVSHSIPANFLKVGDIIRIRAAARATATNSTDTLTLKLKLGTTVIATTATIDVANGDAGFFDVSFRVRSIGATGSIATAGEATLKTTTTAVTGVHTIDTTAANAVAVTATWSVANAGNSAELTSLEIERTSAAEAGENGGDEGYALMVAMDDRDLTAESDDTHCPARAL